MNAIVLKKIKKIYHKKNEKITIFNNYNHSFEYGKLYGIMGHSGSGKTTLIKIIGTIENIDSGTILIDNQEITTLKDNQKAKMRNEKIGFVFQNYLLDDNLNIYENVLLPTLINKDCKINSQRITDLLKKYQLTDRMKHKPNELSGGECQRVAICRALINDPQIILADEPTGNLDKKNETFVLEELKQLAKSGKCVIVVSHSDSIVKYADCIIDLDEMVGKKDEK